MGIGIEDMTSFLRAARRYDWRCRCRRQRHAWWRTLSKNAFDKALVNKSQGYQAKAQGSDSSFCAKYSIHQNGYQSHRNKLDNEHDNREHSNPREVLITGLYRALCVKYKIAA